MYYLYWPLTAFLTLFLVVGVIMILLRFGPRICKARHHTLPDETDWREKTYDQPLGYDF